jgi:hypothetical protein
MTLIASMLVSRVAFLIHLAAHRLGVCLSPLLTLCLAMAAVVLSYRAEVAA